MSISPELQAALWTILVGVVVNATCGVIGCFLVLRRMSLLGDAISHAIVPGIAMAFLLTGRVAAGPMFLGAVAVGLLTAALTHLLTAVGDVSEDSSLGVVFTSFFSLGVLLISYAARNVHLDPGCVLYGTIELAPIYTRPILGVEVPRALFSLAASAGCVTLFVLLFWKELKVVAFDPMLAEAMGIRVQVVHYLLMGMVAGVSVSAFEQVGSILVVAMLIVPGATAQLLSPRLGAMVLWSAGVGAAAAVLGYAAAAALNTSVAGMMAVAVGFLFLLAVLFAPGQGLVARAVQQILFSLQIAGEDVLATIYRREESQGGTVAMAADDALACAGRGWRAQAAILHQRALGRLQLGSDGAFRLTEKGRNRAQSLVRSHRLWEAYIGEHFELPLDHLHDSAERVEHYIGPSLQQELAEALKEPGIDPHGRPIPPGGESPCEQRP